MDYLRVRDEASVLSNPELVAESLEWWEVTRHHEPDETADRQLMDLENLADQVNRHERMARAPTFHPYLSVRERLLGYCVQQRLRHDGRTPDQVRAA